MRTWRIAAFLGVLASVGADQTLEAASQPQLERIGRRSVERSSPFVGHYTRFRDNDADAAAVPNEPVPCALQAGAPAGPPIGEGSLLCDVDGLIVHKATGEHPFGDGGDTAQREGWYWLGVWIRENTPGLPPYTPRRKLTFDQVLALLEPGGDGVFYRHPKLAPWNNPFDKKFGLSRDQMEPLVAAMGVWGKYATLQRLWDALPEDALGKHSFNGSYKNFLGQEGWDCAAVKRRGCDATRDCSLKMDTRDCSLKLDTRDCSLQVDTRNCEMCLLDLGFGCLVRGNHPGCEAEKAAQNLIYKGIKDKCEVEKAAQNALYAGEKAACEAAKATQNAAYKAEKDACEVVKAGEKLTCEANKAIDLNLCRTTNYHDGDFIGPVTEHLFARAKNEALGHSLAEPELLAGTLLRISQASDKDNVGDDLNLLVKLLMSKLRSPTTISETAVAAYASYRPFSFGSYLRTYREMYGPNNPDDMQARIATGMRSGWKADRPPVNGAVHWYHRLESGGNPELAELYDPIIDRFIYGDLTGAFSTSEPTHPAPTITRATVGPASSSGHTSITITGSNFIHGATVLVNGHAATNVVVVNDRTITAEIAQALVGNVSVSVTVPWPGGGTAETDTLTSTNVPAGDFDGDGRADVAVYRPNGGMWYVIQSGSETGSGMGWGLPTDVPVPGDYDGDDRTDYAVYRPSSGTWFVLRSSTGAGVALEWGMAGDIPVPGDYDADGKTDFAVFRPSSGVWFVLPTATGAAYVVQWGQNGDHPVPADFDGDGKTDVTVFRPSTGAWYQLRSMSGGFAVTWGTSGDLPLAGDYDGDGKADPTVFRQSSGAWYQLRSTEGPVFAGSWGGPGDVPIVGDYDGDGRSDLTVFRPSAGIWYQLRSLTGAAFTVVWGHATDYPM